MAPCPPSPAAAIATSENWHVFHRMMKSHLALRGLLNAAIVYTTAKTTKTVTIAKANSFSIALPFSFEPEAPVYSQCAYDPKIMERFLLV
jgi:hypothetical protein